VWVIIYHFSLLLLLVAVTIFLRLRKLTQVGSLCRVSLSLTEIVEAISHVNGLHILESVALDDILWLFVRHGDGLPIGRLFLFFRYLHLGWLLNFLDALFVVSRQICKAEVDQFDAARTPWL
jgi:hypothetical protein